MTSSWLTQTLGSLKELMYYLELIHVYTDAMLHGRRSGPPGSPAAFETIFGWVLAGKIDSHASTHVTIVSHHVSVISGDDLLRQFWEIEENPKDSSNLSSDERSVIQHFKDTHTRSEEGRFIVPLPKKPKSKPLGESRSQAVRRFLSHYAQRVNLKTSPMSWKNTLRWNTQTL